MNTSLATRPPMTNDDAELAVLGSILVDPECLWDIKSVLKPDDFSLVKHRHIYTAALALADIGSPIDIITLSDELLREGVAQHAPGAYIVGLMASAPSSINALSYAEVVADTARRRNLIKLSSEIAKRAYDAAESVDKTVTWITSTASDQSRGGELKRAEAVVDEVYAEFERNMAAPLKPGQVRGLDTGWLDLNTALGGWKPGLYVVLGEPHVGKSFFAIHAAQNVAARGGRALVFSLEMTAAQLIRRLCLAHAGISQYEYDQGRVPDAAIAPLYNHMAEIATWQLDIVDDMDTASAIFSTIHRECRGDNPPDLVVIDYIGLIVTDYRADNRNAELSELLRSMKRLSDSNQIPLIGPHQISDKAIQNRTDKRPKKSDGYNSGGISQHADVILGLFDESLHTNMPANPNTLEIIKLNDRLSGGADPFASVKLRFEPTGALKDWTPQEAYDGPQY